MDKLQNLEREAKEVSKKLHDFLRETANILNEPAEKRAEVIVHELLHLRYPNHGKMFKLLMNHYLYKGK